LPEPPTFREQAQAEVIRRLLAKLARAGQEVDASIECLQAAFDAAGPEGGPSGLRAQAMAHARTARLTLQAD
jgi:hypothetical protein